MGWAGPRARSMRLDCLGSDPALPLSNPVIMESTLRASLFPSGHEEKSLAVCLKFLEQGVGGPPVMWPWEVAMGTGMLSRPIRAHSGLGEARRRHALPAGGVYLERLVNQQPLAPWHRAAARGPGAPVTTSPALPFIPRPPFPLLPVPSAPPRKVEAEALNATAIRVLWRSPAPGRQHGQIRGYQVHYVRMEGAEARGPPRIKDVMLADAQVGGALGGAWRAGSRAGVCPTLCSCPRCFSVLWPPAHLSSLPRRLLPRSVGDG